MIIRDQIITSSVESLRKPAQCSRVVCTEGHDLPQGDSPSDSRVSCCSVRRQLRAGPNLNEKRQKFYKHRNGPTLNPMAAASSALDPSACVVCLWGLKGEISLQKLYLQGPVALLVGVGRYRHVALSTSPQFPQKEPCLCLTGAIDQ